MLRSVTGAEATELPGRSVMMVVAAQYGRKASSLEDVRKAVMSADAAVSNAANRVADYIEQGDEVDPQVFKVLTDLERVAKTMMRSTKVLTTKRLARR
jgi:uncharacterized protein with PhoU and TrkA domain